MKTLKTFLVAIVLLSFIGCAAYLGPVRGGHGGWHGGGEHGGR